MALLRNVLFRRLLAFSAVVLMVVVSSPWIFGSSAPTEAPQDPAATPAAEAAAQTPPAAEQTPPTDAPAQDAETEAGDVAPAEEEVEEEGEMDPLQIEVDCETAPAFPAEVFAPQADGTKVYLQPSDLPESIFTKMGFGQFITIFGIPIVASKDVLPEVLNHAGRIFAEYLDNDEDGVADHPEALEVMRQYRTIIGYVSGPEESDSLWTERFRDEENEAFRTQFVCNMHFFEQWASDATPGFHNMTDAALLNSDDDEKFCAERSQSEFDWPLWYFPFTATYYGYLEKFDNATIDKIEATMNKAQEAALFTGSYPDDHDMELSDFFVWSMITRLGALRCHCNSEVVLEAWKACRLEQLEEFDADWVQLLGTLEGLPTRLPDAKYDTPAIVAA